MVGGSAKSGGAGRSVIIGRCGRVEGRKVGSELGGGISSALSYP